MKRPQILPAFTPGQQQAAHELLATRVAFMMGRKFEEGDWADVYCAFKGIPHQGWSNLKLDVVHEGLGVEHKMLRPGKPVTEVFGARLMHPSATRSIRIVDGEPNAVMADVLAQYAEFLRLRREHVRQHCPAQEPDLRTGWLLWQTNLREFVYFEEEIIIPDPVDYIAEWHENRPQGTRKASKSLWIYERHTGQKKFSVTTDAGAKIQPYFDVPPASAPNLYVFRVQGEELAPGFVRVWIPLALARELSRLAGELSPTNLHNVAVTSLTQTQESGPLPEMPSEKARPLLLTSQTYALLTTHWPNAVSDAHKIQLFVELLSR